MTTDEEKSEARAYLSAFADNMPDKRTSMILCQTVMDGEANFKEYIDQLLCAVHLLRDEFAAWGETNRDSYDIVFFADMAKDFDDDFREKFLDEAGASDVVKFLVCHLIRSVFFLREDLLAWGKDDQERMAAEEL